MQRQAQTVACPLGRSPSPVPHFVAGPPPGRGAVGPASPPPRVVVPQPGLARPPAWAAPPAAAASPHASPGLTVKYASVGVLPAPGGSLLVQPGGAQSRGQLVQGAPPPRSARPVAVRQPDASHTPYLAAHALFRREGTSPVDPPGAPNGQFRREGTCPHEAFSANIPVGPARPQSPRQQVRSRAQSPNQDPVLLSTRSVPALVHSPRQPSPRQPSPWQPPRPLGTRQPPTSSNSAWRPSVTGQVPSSVRQRTPTPPRALARQVVVPPPLHQSPVQTSSPRLSLTAHRHFARAPSVVQFSTAGAKPRPSAIGVSAPTSSPSGLQAPPPQPAPCEAASSPHAEVDLAVDLPSWLEEFALEARSKGSSAAVIKEVLANDVKMRELARHCFEMFDVSRARVLDFETLHKCIGFLSLTLGVGSCSRQDLVRFARRFDTAGDEHLNVQEFEELYRHLLLAKLNEYEPATFSRDMFIRRRPGQLQDHYTVLQELGKGTCGLVKMLEEKKTRTKRVVKVVDKQHAMDSGLPLKVVMEEIDKLKTLDHPALLRLFEYFVDDQALYLVTDLMAGGVLLEAIVQSHIKGQPLTEHWNRKVFLDICEGIAYAHAKGVMHKDLKLDNIMLACPEPPKAVVIDVGFAELFPPGDADDFHSAVHAGTLSIMAPEVIRGSFTYKCDVWSLGCCLYGLLCRRPDAFRKPDGSMEVHPYPFRPPEGRSREEMQAFMNDQAQGPNFSLVRGGDDVRDLLRLMLTFEDRPRPRMKQVLAHPWFREAREKQRRLLNPKQVDCLLNFHDSNAMEQAVLLDVASQLPIEKLQEMAQIFASIDKDGNGMLNAEELAVAMEQAGQDPHTTEQAVQRLTKEGPVEFSRFVAALMTGRRGSLVAHHLQPAFERLDTDGDGYLSQHELQALLQDGSQRRSVAATTAENMLKAVSASQQRVSLNTFVQVLGSGTF